MDTIDLRPATAALQRLVLGTSDDRLAAPTPCTRYVVGDLVDHIGGLTLAFTGAARKEPVPGAEGGGTGDVTRLRPGWRDRIVGDLDRLAAAWCEPDAYQGTTMAGPVEMAGNEAAVVALNEVVVHGWDLAVATGQPFDVDPGSLEICLGFAQAFSTPETEELRGDAFGRVVPVPDDAPALDRLLGLMGRRYGWRPAPAGA